MRIFGKQTAGKDCGCQAPSIKAAAVNPDETEAAVKILGSGCAKCAALEKAVRTAAEAVSYTHLTLPTKREVYMLEGADL